MVWFAYSVGDMPFTNTVSYGVTDATGKVVRRDDFEAPLCSMVHDFLVTRRPRALPHPAADRQPAAGDERRPGLRLGAGQGLARRRDGPRRRRRDHPLVHHRRLLRLPPDERLGGGRQDLRRRDGISGRAALPDARRQHAARTPLAQLVRWTFDLADALEHDQARAAGRPGRRVPALRRAARGALLPARLVRRHQRRRRDTIRFDTIAHIDHATGRRVDCRFAGRRLARRAGVRAAHRRTRPRATAGWWRWSTAARRTAATSWSSTPRTSPRARSPSPGCRAASRSASTATGGRLRASSVGYADTFSSRPLRGGGEGRARISFSTSAQRAAGEGGPKGRMRSLDQRPVAVLELLA